MNYLVIKDPTHAALKKIQSLYETAFPERERRDFSQLLTLLEVDNMQLISVEDASIAIGFLIQWEFDKFIYLEHFAIDLSHRGKNYGSKIIQQVIQNTPKFLLLEVEPPGDEIGARRVKFYDKLGLKICPFDYQQPPYRKNETAFPMLIMSYPRELSKVAFEQYTAIIKAEVYER